jgi:hypothetical protein
MEKKFPTYLANIIDDCRYSENSRLFNKQLLKNIPCRINRVKASFFPSTINDWNKLELEIRLSKSLNIFKKRISKQTRVKKSSYFGLRNNNKVRFISMLRLELSPLRAHKHKHKFEDTSDPYCIVCGKIEDTSHYLIHCKSYRLARVTLLQKVSDILSVNISTLPKRRILSILLYGSEDMSAEQNHSILLLVTMFIEQSKRLDKI